MLFLTVVFVYWLEAPGENSTQESPSETTQIIPNLTSTRCL